MHAFSATAAALAGPVAAEIAADHAASRAADAVHAAYEVYVDAYLARKSIATYLSEARRARESCNLDQAIEALANANSEVSLRARREIF